MKKLFIPALLVMVFIASGCSSKKKVTIDPSDKGSDKVMYENAMKYISKNPENARILFKEIMQLYPDSIYAGKAKLGIGDSYFRTNDSASLVMAAAEYQEYVNLYPYSPDAVYAKYQVGMCYFKQMRKPERDQSNTFAAIKAFEGLLQQYPNTNEADEAKKKINQCRQNLANHYFQIGYYNYTMKAYPGAIARFKQIMDEYPDFSKNDKLFFYTGKTYLAMQDLDSALSFFQRLVGNYAKSKYAKKSQPLIKKINLLQKAKPKTSEGAGK
ncbi:MAG: outer membrane protein assembly factor BamD [Candidatus Aminicenantes bacterium]|nr:outer membrane protein assembly factor BamD [Candidatus Aminicenantes bacterium]